MAENIAFKITVDTDVADLTVGQLKQAFKDLTQEINTTEVGTAKYKQTLTKLGDVKGALKDVKEQINALDPEKKFRAIAQVGSSIASGFAAAQGAVALFGGESEDLQKVLVRVQAATALASGLQGLAGFGKALETAGLAMKAFALSNPFTAIAAAVVALVVVVYSLVEAFDDTQESVDKLAKSNEQLADSYKRIGDESEMAVRKIKALGGTEQQIFNEQQRRREEELENLRQRILNLQEIGRSEIGLTDEQFKELSALEDQFALKKKDIAISKLEFEKATQDRIAEEQSKHFDELEALQAKADARAKKAAEERAKELEEIRKRIRTKINEEGAEDAQIRYDEIVNTYNTNKAFREQAEADESAARRRRLDEEKIVADFRVMVQSESFKTIGELALAFAGKSEASQRRAFQINKAAGIAQTTIDTFIGAQKAYASQLIPGDPSSPVRAAIAAGFSIAQGLARVAIIAKTQFDSKSAPADTGGSVNAPNLQSPQTANNNAVTISQRGVNEDQQGNFAGFQQPIKAYVVETEMTSAQKTIQSIEQRTTF